MEVQEYSFPAMGTLVELRVVVEHSTNHSDVTQFVHAVKHQIETLERQLSRFQSHSDVSRLNQLPGQWIPVFPTTAEVLRLAHDAWSYTSGLFHPCIGLILEEIGYDRSFEHVPEEATQLGQIEAYLPTGVGYQIRDDGSHVRLNRGLKLDLGGIAKGFIVEQAARTLQDFGIRQCVVSAGGDMVCVGKRYDRPWVIEIENPLRTLTDLPVTVHLDSLAMATSGTYKRQWVRNDQRVHHIVDPRTRSQSDSDIISCSVIHPRLVVAEVMAKTALLLGSKNGIEWLQNHSNRGWVLITRTGEVHHAWKSSMSAK